MAWGWMANKGVGVGESVGTGERVKVGVEETRGVREGAAVAEGVRLGEAVGEAGVMETTMEIAVGKEVSFTTAGGAPQAASRQTHHKISTR